VQTSEKLAQFLFQMRSYEARLGEQITRQFSQDRQNKGGPPDIIQNEFDKSK